MATVDEKTRRVRSLLSSYYGVDGPQSQAGTPRSEHSDTPSAHSAAPSRSLAQRAPAGLDSAAFDVDRCDRAPGNDSSGSRSRLISL